MKIGSLFSGIGGLELGLERAGLGTVAWQCEADEYCRSVLAQHWPDVERFTDVREMLHPADVDLICGGFPCQDLSAANVNGTGLAGPRSGLWFEMLRIVGTVLPSYVVIENVHQTWRRWVPFVRRGLHDLGYASVPVRVRAADVGARHRRARCFIVAWAPYVDRQGQLQPHRADGEERRRSLHAAAQAAADAHRQRLEERRPDRVQEQPPASGCLEAWPGAGTTEPPLVQRVHGLPRDVAGLRRQRIKALGNSVVPPVAECVGYLIPYLTNLES